MSVDFSSIAAAVGTVSTLAAVAHSMYAFIKLKREAQAAHAKVILSHKNQLELVINGERVTIDTFRIDQENPEKLDKAIRDVIASRSLPNAA